MLMVRPMRMIKARATTKESSCSSQAERRRLCWSRSATKQPSLVVAAPASFCKLLERGSPRSDCGPSMSGVHPFSGSSFSGERRSLRLCCPGHSSRSRYADCRAPFFFTLISHPGNRSCCAAESDRSAGAGKALGDRCETDRKARPGKAHLRGPQGAAPQAWTRRRE